MEAAKESGPQGILRHLGEKQQKDEIKDDFLTMPANLTAAKKHLLHTFKDLLVLRINTFHSSENMSVFSTLHGQKCVY